MFTTVCAVVLILMGIVLGVPALQCLKRAGASNMTGREVLEAEAGFHIYAFCPMLLICAGLLLLVVK